MTFPDAPRLAALSLSHGNGRADECAAVISDHIRQLAEVEGYFDACLLLATHCLC
jgi:hypothetical protein